MTTGTWVVTGANSGIGLAITKAVLAQGKWVVAVDRKVDAVGDIPSSFLVTRVCDLGDSCQV